MRLTKIVLLFQAIVTLIIGLVFFSQVIKIDQHKLEELRIEIMKGDVLWQDQAQPVLIDLKKRYSVAAWVLMVVSLIEIILISRLVS